MLVNYQYNKAPAYLVLNQYLLHPESYSAYPEEFLTSISCLIPWAEIDKKSPLYQFWMLISQCERSNLTVTS